MSDYINNQDYLLIDELRQEIQKGSKVKIAASCFSMYAFDALKKELKNIEELQFIFSSSAFEKIPDDIKKEKREFFLPNEIREDCIYGTEFEIRLKNKMTQKAIAKECADWIKSKVKFKSNKSNYGMTNFIGVTNKDATTVYMPIEGFTSVDLGIQQDNSYYKIINKLNKPSECQFLFSKFNDLWQDKTRLEDVTNNIIDFLSCAYLDNSPEFIYYIILYNLFNEFLLQIDDYIPNELTGFKDSLIWNKLFNFQQDAAIGIINKLDKYNGCILADSVGLGKTFTALAVMKYYDLRNKNILVLCPKKLSNNWNSYKGNNKTNIFLKDRIRYDVLYHTDLGRVRGHSNGIDLSNIYWENYDLIVIDESHNFRNNFTFRNKETRYDILYNKVINSGVKTKVLMLSATPVNNRFKDLRNQLNLAYGNDLLAFEEKLGIKKSIKQIFSDAQRAFNHWMNLRPEEKNATSLVDVLDLDFSILLDSVTIARSRKHILKYYDTKEIGTFPMRNKPLSYYCNLTDRQDVIDYNEIFKRITSMTMSLYAPTSYILGSKALKYSEIYDIETSTGSTLKQSSREITLQRLMTISMLKRLESCVDSFRITLTNILNKNQDTLNKIEQHKRGEKTYLERSLKEFTEIEVDEVLDDNDFPDIRGTTIGKVKIDLADMDLISWERDLNNDIHILKGLLTEMTKVDEASDAKLNQLKALIDTKINNPYNIGNKKFLIFSAFADTTNYLYKKISRYVKSKYGLDSAKVQGGIGDNESTIGTKSMDEILTLFSPLSREKSLVMPNDSGVIDVLIGTDCISEGQNLQDSDICINYDIHWNPVRIVQRFGRIDRIGSKNTAIQLVCFWPNISLDEYINLNNRVMSRMTIVDATATGDDNILAEKQIELDYRKVQLKKLQEGELQDLEDVEGNVNITDLGLNDFRMDLINYVKEKGEPKRVPKGMHAVIPSDSAKGLYKGVIYVLKNNNRGVDLKKQNRLHPYYVVYIAEDGNVVYNHLDVKQILDLLRANCKGIDKPIEDICREFNIDTKDGFKMDKYSVYLEKAIGSIIEVKEEKDIDSLFKTGGTTALTGTIKGLNDFELIAFVVVR